MSTPVNPWHNGESQLVVFARNLATRYLLMLGAALGGIIVLPLNLKYLGESEYGLWNLIASITVYFTVLELGYGGAIVKFVAEYRARKDARALNEILSTMFYVFSGIGVLVYAVAIVVSFLLPYIFNLDAAQARTGQIVLLLIAVNVALHFPFSIFGGVINGFERYYINNLVGGGFVFVIAVVNVAVLLLGYGLVELVTATTIVRLIPYWIYRRNAYSVFPQLEIRRDLFRRDRLRELTGFSAYMAVIDWSGKLTYTTDTFILGMFLNTTAVAMYAVAQRLSEALLRLTNQLHTFLFPAIVHRAVGGEAESQRRILVTATRFQMAVAAALCGVVGADADVLIRAWVGPGFETAALVLQVLAVVVAVRTLMAVPATVLKGTGHHKMMAAASCWCALANLLLSIVAVKTFGIVGVAAGTVIPAVALAGGVIFPRACRVVGLTAWQGYRRIVWPVTWPAVVMVALLAATKHALPIPAGSGASFGALMTVLPHMAAGGALYAGLFILFGLDREERQWFSSAITQVWRRSFAIA